MAWHRRTIVQSSRCKSKALSAVFLSLRKNLASHSGVHVILWHSVLQSCRKVWKSRRASNTRRPYNGIGFGSISAKIYRVPGGTCPPRPLGSDGLCHLMTLWEWKQPLTDDWTHISQPTRECWTIKRMGPSHHDNVVAEKWQKLRFVARKLHTRVWNCRNECFWSKLVPNSYVCSELSPLQYTGLCNNDLGLF